MAFMHKIWIGRVNVGSPIDQWSVGDAHYPLPYWPLHPNPINLPRFPDWRPAPRVTVWVAPKIPQEMYSTIDPACYNITRRVQINKNTKNDASLTQQLYKKNSKLDCRCHQHNSNYLNIWRRGEVELSSGELHWSTIDPPAIISPGGF